MGKFGFMNGNGDNDGAGKGLLSHVRTGVGLRPAPLYRPRSRPALNVAGVGFLLGSMKHGSPHLNRIADWLLDAFIKHQHDGDMTDSRGLVALYLSDRERLGDHSAWLWDCLVATKMVPAKANNPQFIADQLAEAHRGWIMQSHIEIERLVEKPLKVEAFIRAEVARQQKKRGAA